MSLRNLIALQKSKATTESPPTTNPPATLVEESESRKAEPLLTAVKPKGLGLNQAAKIMASKPANLVPSKVETPEFSLGDLASMDAGSIAVKETVVESQFDDEIEATAPDRELPADISADQMNFVESLDGIYGILHDAEMLGQSVRMIMMELQENPEYERLLSDSDLHTMIRGMRRTMGLARVRKQEKSRKAGTQKNAKKTSGVSDHAMNLLNQLMRGEDD